MNVDDFEKELKLGFLDEAMQAIEEVEQSFLVLEANPQDKTVLDKIFRLAHNLKGSSKAVGFEQMGAFTHEFESLMLKLKNDELQVLPQTVNLMLRCNDYIRYMVESLKEDLDASFEFQELIAEIENAKNGQFAEMETVETSAPSAAEFTNKTEDPLEFIKQTLGYNPADEQALAPGVKAKEDKGFQLDLESVLGEVKKLSENNDPLPLKTTPDSIVSPESQNKNKSKEGNSPKTASGSQTDESIRVSLSRLEKLQNYVGEMVILQSVLREQLSDSTPLFIKKTSHQLGKVVKEIQDITMHLRMVPVKPTFQKMQRIVRDTAQALSKDVMLKVSGEETELDKTVLEKINDPLVHLIRNSVDHGIEAVDLHLKRGKKPQGEVQLNAYHQSGKLVIEVKDDGGGLDAEKLKALAVKKGIIKENLNLTEAECWNLIFAPGFSTKEQVTDVSGRGVGMDVVRTNIQELSGEIQIISEKLKGTTFKIILPLTLAIVDGMVVQIGEEKYVIPLSHVHESIKPTDKQIQFNTGIGEILLLRGENLPLYRMCLLLGKKVTANLENMIAIVIRTGKEPFALLVDDIIGQFQVVIKQLGPELQSIKGFSGSTILGDGRPSLIIEPLDLVRARGKTINNIKPQEIGRAS